MALRSLFLDQLWLKLFSLLLATLIWLTVRANVNSPTRERRFTRLPVVLMTESAEYRSFTLNPELVNITVRGPAPLIDELQDRNIQAFVQLSGEQNVAGSYPVEVHVPHGISVVLVAPRTIHVHMANAP